MNEIVLYQRPAGDDAAGLFGLGAFADDHERRQLAADELARLADGQESARHTRLAVQAEIARQLAGPPDTPRN